MALEVLASGSLNSIQDCGRRHALGMGVSVGGAMDRFALEVANLLVGNDRDAAGIEVVFFPFRVRFHVDTIFALTGADANPVLDGEPIPPWWARQARAGQTLVLGAPRDGVSSYLAIRGGLDVPQVLGSRATDRKAHFGGLEGRGLERGDRLSLCPAIGVVRSCPETGWGARIDVLGNKGAVRVLPAAEWTCFQPEARDIFLHDGWTVTAQANRAGYRLDGRELRLRHPLNLMSHGIVPGTVQVPPAGLPIIQMADANTCGGYPKIATVIEADLRCVAQVPVGGTIRFELTTRDEARQALQARQTFLAALTNDLRMIFQ